MKTPMVDDQNHYITIPIGSMYAIYGNIYYQYTVPQMLAYIPAPWILWVMILEVPICSKCIQLLSLHILGIIIPTDELHNFSEG